MKLIQQYGYIWKLSDTSYKKLLQKIAKGQDYDLGELGKELGPLSPDTLDMSPSHAQSLLDGAWMK